MGNSLEQWRASIGQYHGPMPREGRTIHDVGECGSMAFALVVVATLLVMGGIELNPGPHTQTFKYPETTAKPKVDRRLPGRAEMTGELYEVGMVTLLFLKGLFEKASFTLGTNVEGVGALDDVAFTWQEKTSNSDHKVYIQLKHLKNKPVLQSMLCAKQGKFSIFNYFNSFCQAKEDIRNRSLFVLFTNAPVMRGTTQREPNSLLKQLLNTAVSSNKILCFQKGDEEYQILEKLYKDTLKKISAMTGGVKAIRKELEPFQQVDACKKLIGVINNQKEFEALLNHQLSQELDEKLWEQFMDKFCLFSCQASEKELDPVIKKTLEEYVGTDKIFQDLKTAVITWWREDVAYTITHEYAPFWDEIMKKHISGLVKPISEKLSSIPELTFVERKDFGRVCFFKDCTILSCLWVQQCASAVGHIMVDSNTLTTHTEEVLAIWKFCTWCKLLVVEGDLEIKLVERLASILTGDKQLIAISKNADELAKLLVQLIETKSITININVKGIEIYDECFRLDQLDEISQVKVLERDVVFQGSLVKLRSLADEATLRDVVTADIVMQLFSVDSPMSVRESLPSHQDGFYIPRKIFRKEVIGNNVFKSDLILAVSGISEIELKQLLPSSEGYQKFDAEVNVNRSCRYFLITGRSDFDALTNEFPQSVHWIEKCETDFIWRYTNGNLETVKEYLEQSVVDYEDIELFLNIPHQVVLVVAEPGMGKSIELTNVAQQLKGFDPTIWVVRVNLIEHTQYLSQSDSSAEGLLMNAGNFKSDFERKLLEHQLKPHGKVVILFDGMDEISPKYTDKVIDMLKKLLGISLKIWLTSRPFMRERLENEFHTLPFNFVPFSGNDQEEFFRKSWKMPNEISHDLIHFIERLLTVIRNSLNDSLMKFTSIPLQAKMLAEVCQTQVLRYTETGEMNISDRLDLLSLYRKFVDRKWEVYRSKLEVDASKPGNDEDSEDLKEMFENKLMNCSLITLLDEDVEKLHNPEKIRKNNQKFVSEFKAGRERKGLVADVKNDKAIFIHQTFAEYFAALWFSKNYSSNLKCLREIYVTPKYKIVRCFFDRIMCENCELHTDVLNYDKTKVERLLSDSKHDVNRKDEGGRLALHLAVSNFLEADTEEYRQLPYVRITRAICTMPKICDGKLSEIVNALLRKQTNVNEKDNIFCLTPLQFAEQIRSWPAVGILLDNDVDSADLVFIPDKISQHDDEFVHCLLNVSAMFGYVNLMAFMLKCNDNLTDLLESKKLLHIAAAFGHLRLVQFLIETGMNIDVRDDYYATPLMWAALKGYVQMIKYLKDRGADLDAVDSSHYSALRYAVREGNVESVNILLEFKADIHSIDGVGKTLLMLSLEMGHVEIVKLLLKQGSDPQTLDQFLNSSLHYAVNGHNIECVNIVLDLGLDVNCRNMFGRSVLTHAFDRGEVEIAKLLLEKGAHPNNLDEDGNSLLHYAVGYQCNIDCVNILLDRGLDVNCRNKKGVTPLMKVIKTGAKGTVKLLLDKGADPNKLDEDGNSMLHYAVGYQCNIDCVNILLDLGLDVNCRNKRGVTPLMKVFEKPEAEIAKLLLDKGADPNILDEDDNSMLHYAVEWLYNIDCVGTLLELGLDVNCRNKKGVTPLMTVFEKGETEIAELLLDKGADPNVLDEDGNSMLHYAVGYQCNISCVNILLELGLDVNCRNNSGESPLMNALNYHDVETVKFLLDKGADRNILDEDGNSMLHYAVGYQSNIDCVNILLDLGLDVNYRNKRGVTPLMKVFESRGTEIEIVKYLLNKGADPNILDEDGNSMLHYAVGWHSNVNCVDILLDLGLDVFHKNKSGETPLMKATPWFIVRMSEFVLKQKVTDCEEDEMSNN